MILYILLKLAAQEQENLLASRQNLTDEEFINNPALSKPN
jgi:hypothetical protein